MVEISDEVRCVFHGEIERRDGSFVIEVPEREVVDGGVESGAVHRVALFHPAGAERDPPAEPTPDPSPATEPAREPGATEPPVSAGDRRTVDIEDIGEQGDGIARVDRGYVVVVPDTEKGERVTIEITDVKESVGFGEVIEREPYYE